MSAPDSLQIAISDSVGAFRERRRRVRSIPHCPDCRRSQEVYIEEFDRSEQWLRPALFDHETTERLWTVSGICCDSQHSRAINEILAFTDCEQDEIVRMNPLLRSIRSGAVRADAALIFRDHVLLEKMNLIRTLFRCGVLPINICFVPKVDNTPYRAAILASLARMGVHVAAPASPVGHSDSDAMITRAHEFAERHSGPLVVSDDGGDLIKLLRDNGFEAIWIEGTTKGSNLLSRSGYRSDVIDLSKSAVKSRQSRKIALSCLTAAAHGMRHMSWDGRQTLVVGYGAIGAEIARLAPGFGLRVSYVVDPDSARRSAARSALGPGVQVVDSLADLPDERSVEMIFGCVGRASVGPQDLERISGPHVVLCPVSSRDFSPAYRAMQQSQRFDCNATNVGTRFVNRHGGQEVHVLAKADAVNLFRYEGVNDPDFDEFTAELATTILSSLCADGACSEGPHRQLPRVV